MALTDAVHLQLLLVRFRHHLGPLWTRSALHRLLLIGCKIDLGDIDGEKDASDKAHA